LTTRPQGKERRNAKKPAPSYTRGDICPASTRWRLRLGGSTGGHARPASPPHICSTPFDHTHTAAAVSITRPPPPKSKATPTRPAGRRTDPRSPSSPAVASPTSCAFEKKSGPVISWPVGHLIAVFNRTQFPTPHLPDHLPPPGHTPLPRRRATRIIFPPAGPDLQSQASAHHPTFRSRSVQSLTPP
jgi:hypothetical protein